MFSSKPNLAAANGIALLPLATNEEPSAVLAQIEHTIFAFVRDLIHGRVDGEFRMVQCASDNAHEDLHSGALLLGDRVSVRKFNARTAKKVGHMFQVLAVVHALLRGGRRLSQRELFYLLVESFRDQQQLNATVLDVSAMLGVPRFALNIGAATRGVLAGCLRLAVTGSLSFVDCEFVGTNGWPIPGDVRTASSLVVHSRARYIIIIEKFGIFSRLVQDKFFEQLPCILLCGKGYPSVATRAVVCLLETRLRIPVLGLADFNPHGLALLQCYRRGSARTGIEGSRFTCNVRWLGLRSSHIRHYLPLSTSGTPLTTRDTTLLSGLQRDHTLLRTDMRYTEEMAAMHTLGKHELQALYAHEHGMRFFSHDFLLTAILHGDYV